MENFKKKIKIETKNNKDFDFILNELICFSPINRMTALKACDLFKNIDDNIEPKEDESAIFVTL